MHETQEEQNQNVDTLPLLRIGNKTPNEGVTETMFGAVMNISSLFGTGRDKA